MLLLIDATKLLHSPEFTTIALKFPRLSRFLSPYYIGGCHLSVQCKQKPSTLTLNECKGVTGHMKNKTNYFVY